MRVCGKDSSPIPHPPTASRSGCPPLNRAYCLCGPNCLPECSLSVSSLHIYTCTLPCLVNTFKPGRQGWRTDSQRNRWAPRGHGVSSGSQCRLDSLRGHFLATHALLGGLRPGLGLSPRFPPSSCPFPPLRLSSVSQMCCLLSCLHTRAHTCDPTEPSCPTQDMKDPDSP